MKHIMLMMAVLCLLVLVRNVAWAIVPEDDIVGIWLMEEADGLVMDSSDNGLHGDIQGDVEPVAGKFGTAISLFGLPGSWMKIPFADPLNLTRYTICAWVKLEVKDWQGILQRGNVETSGIVSYGLYTAPGGFVTSCFSDDGGGWNTVLSTTSVTDDIWHHVAGSYDGDMPRIYIDGNLENELALKATPAQHEESIGVGGDSRESANAQGAIDEIVLVSRALTEDEIGDIMTNGASGVLAVSDAGKLVAVWGRIKGSPAQEEMYGSRDY